MAKKTKQEFTELLYGIHPIIELLKAKKRKLVRIYTTKPTPKQWSEIEKHMPAYPVPIQYVSRDVLHRMAGTTDHQGVLAYARQFPFRKKPFEKEKSPFVVMLDSLQDARNLGAILRSAYCTGASGVMITTRNSASLNPVALKSSAGLAEHLDIMLVPSTHAGLEELKKAGYSIYLTMLNGKDATTLSYDLPLALVIGNEAVGIAKPLARFGTAVTLPQKTADISYNASVAAGIMLFMVSTRNKLV